MLGFKDDDKGKGLYLEPNLVFHSEFGFQHAGAFRLNVFVKGGGGHLARIPLCNLTH